MLSRDTIALVEQDSTSLELCRIVEESDGGAPFLHTLVRLGLPPLTLGVSAYYSCCVQEIVPAYSDASPVMTEGRPPRRVPFHNSTEDGLVAVGMDIGDYPDMTLGAITFTIVTHLRTLVEFATRTSPGVTFIPWENWGSRVTACFDKPILSSFHAFIGDRLAVISDDGRLFLHDFDSSRIRNAIRRTRNSSGHSGHTTTVKHRSVVPRGALFREDVVGELPYIFIVKPASLDWRCPVNYEEVLAGISRNVRGRLFPSSVASGH